MENYKYLYLVVLEFVDSMVWVVADSFEDARIKAEKLTNKRVTGITCLTENCIKRQDIVTKFCEIENDNRLII